MGENDAQAPHLILLEAIDAAYANHTGKGLGTNCCPVEIERGDKWARLAWINDSAPFGVLAHNAESDPKFIYVNNAAIRMFGYRRDEFIGLPSRLSASEDRRAARAAFLEIVRARGIAENYADVRVDRSGCPFRIRDGTVWQFDGGDVVGQAALIWFDGKVD
ncbi:PAS domain S-box-containing protein [Singulisphaera sp. GP187]|uniref:MEKHLA domain-containing protein n=1 Tax=Singulisphaera sp. GP187 TaxID=1882752 RepID=UPI000928C9A1|nr:MEKHLA domain-containing protein [Singulisphaera sp. GP187]SIO66698.1 PAS domain S-box-containing protein [Singulisphaera sp. GP187]